MKKKIHFGYIKTPFQDNEINLIPDSFHVPLASLHVLNSDTKKAWNECAIERASGESRSDRWYASGIVGNCMS